MVWVRLRLSVKARGRARVRARGRARVTCSERKSAGVLTLIALVPSLYALVRVRQR